MSPFSIYLRELRSKRRLLQKDAALILGYEQSYLSALETSKKGPPNGNFISSLTSKFNLTDGEITQLDRELQKSQRMFAIPVDSDLTEYEVFNLFREKFGSLKPQQLELVKFALELQC